MLKKLLLPIFSVAALCSSLSSTTVTTVVAGAALLNTTPAFATCSIEDYRFDPENGFIGTTCDQGPKFPFAIVSCSVDPGVYEECSFTADNCGDGSIIRVEVTTVFETTHQKCLAVGGTVL